MIKIAINGFGRIGRPALRRILENHPNIEVAAINDLADKETLLHLFKFDSTYGRFELGSSTSKWKLNFLQEPDPAKLPWKDLGIDVVLECSGVFTNFEGAKKHLEAGAKKVIVSAPCEGAEIPTYLLGVNEENIIKKKTI